MKRVFFLVSILVINLLCACKNDSPKKEYWLTNKICDHLYVEMYKTFKSGAFGGDIIANYLTDTLNFRKFIGSVDDNKQAYSYKCLNDSILIEKFNLINIDSNTTVVESKTFSLSKLKQEHKFD